MTHAHIKGIIQSVIRITSSQMGRIATLDTSCLSLLIPHRSSLTHMPDATDRTRVFNFQRLAADVYFTVYTQESASYDLPTGTLDLLTYITQIRACESIMPFLMHQQTQKEKLWQKLHRECDKNPEATESITISLVDNPHTVLFHSIAIPFLRTKRPLWPAIPDSQAFANALGKATPSF